MKIIKPDIKADLPAHAQGKQIYKARIDTSATNLIMEMLAKLYTDPLASALREYVSNAMDAHTKDNVKRPVEVTLPFADSDNNLIVRDFGEGLSYFDVITIYANFGTSNKRDSNELIGGFGIGSKSGLAISDKIFVDSIKDGLLNSFVLERTSDGIITRFLKEDEKTTKPSGTKVTIPVKEEYVPQTGHEILTKYAQTLLGWSKEQVVAHIENDILTNEQDMYGRGILPYNSYLNDFRIKDTWREMENGYINANPDIVAYPTRNENTMSPGLFSGLLIGDVFYPMTSREYVDRAILGLKASERSTYQMFYKNNFAEDEIESQIMARQHHVLKCDVGELAISHSREKIIFEENNTLAKLQDKVQKLGKEVRSELKKLTDTITDPEIFLIRYEANALSTQLLFNLILSNESMSKMLDTDKYHLTGSYQLDAFMLETSFYHGDLDIELKRMENNPSYTFIEKTTYLAHIKKRLPEYKIVLKVKSRKGLRNAKALNKNICLALLHRNEIPEGEALYQALKVDDFRESNLNVLDSHSSVSSIPLLEESEIDDLILLKHTAHIIDYDKMRSDIKNYYKKHHIDSNKKKVSSVNDKDAYCYYSNLHPSSTRSGIQRYDIRRAPDLLKIGGFLYGFNLSDESEIKPFRTKIFLISPKSKYKFNTKTDGLILTAIAMTKRPNSVNYFICPKTISAYNNFKDEYAGNYEEFSDDEISIELTKLYTYIDWLSKDIPAQILLNNNQQMLKVAKDKNLKSIDFFDEVGITEGAIAKHRSHPAHLSILLSMKEALASMQKDIVKHDKTGLARMFPESTWAHQDATLTLKLISELLDKPAPNMYKKEMSYTDSDIKEIIDYIKKNYSNTIDKINKAYDFIIK